MPLSTLRITPSGPGLVEFTDQVMAALNALAAASSAGASTTGLLTLFVRHTSCSLLIQENADPDVRADLHAYFARIAPGADHPEMTWLKHVAEGPDDMPAHIRAALTQTSIGVPVAEGRMLLGRWQGIYLFEHRDRPQPREVVC
ncbi:MAG: secondary thiamine-phosphate synthase enzyme YjbQ, partial [Pseudomonadota bacterium]